MTTFGLSSSDEEESDDDDDDDAALLFLFLFRFLAGFVRACAIMGGEAE